MERLERIQDRLTTLADFQELVRAMQSMAAFHVQQAQSALVGARSYVASIEHAIATASALLTETDRSQLESASGNGMLMAIGSEHGFVGALNEQVLEHIEPYGGKLEVALVGRRLQATANEQAFDCAWSLSAATDVNSVIRIARHVMARLQDAQSVRMVYASYRKGGQYEIVDRSILPLDTAEAAGSQPALAPLHHLPPTVLMRRLSVEYLFAELVGAMMETLASENGARLRLMQSGDHNIGEKLDALRRRARRLRQENITNELYDIVAGTQAVTANEP